MTDVHTEAVEVPAAAPPEAPPPAAEALKPKENAEPAGHTPGGWPVVPLALSGANATVGAVSAAGLAGGPVAAVAAATGAAVLGVAAAARSRKPSSRRAARRTAARVAGRSAARGAALRRGGAGGAGARSFGARGSRFGGGLGARQHRHGSSAAHGSAGLGKTRARAGQPGDQGTGRAGRIKALRAAQQAAAGSRGGLRAQTTAARRAVADARRGAKSAAGRSRLGKRPGLGGRLLGGAARKARAARDAAIARHRKKRDTKMHGALAAKRADVRKAPIRRAARRALRRSAARFHGRRLLAGLLALPVGVLGLVTTPIGRWLGIGWLVHPGRRLYRRMVLTAAEQRAARDEEIRRAQAELEAESDAEAGVAGDGAEAIGNRVERPAADVPVPANVQVSEGSEGEHVSGFRFEEFAAEMEQAARAYDPEQAMEILAMVEGLPAALSSVANVMKILAERSDSEFPLEKEVADGFNDIFTALMSSVAVAEDMGPLFRQAHSQDIARHEDPRNGTEAEKGWNV